MKVFSAQDQLHYPEAPHDNTTDVYFGTTVSDIYRPLENDTAADTKRWVEAENIVTRQYLDAIPYRDDLRKRLSELNDYSKIGLPSHKPDGMYYWFENDGLQNQSVLYRSETPFGEKEVFLDPNKLSTDGTVALTGIVMSPDGRYAAYTISRSGSDWTEIYVMDVKTKQLLDDHIKWAKFTQPSWSGDGFFYNAYDAPESGKEYSNANEYHKVYYHKIGTSQADDTVAFSDMNAPLHFHNGWASEDGSLLVVIIGGEGIGDGVVIKKLNEPQSEFIVVEPSQNYYMEPLDADSEYLMLYTSKGAPNNRVVKVPLDHPEYENWIDVIPESDCVLESVEVTDNYLIAKYLKDAASKAVVYDKKGNKIREIDLPGYGTVTFSASKASPDVFYSFASFTTPSTVYSYDMENNTSSQIYSPELKGFNADEYVTEQVWYKSKDGTEIPMFLVYKKGLKKDGSNPVYLYGYGGFNISLNPAFSANRLLWLENGGIYAQANLRGGGEYGEPWHLAGTKLNKQNVFDDFISAAEYLISQGWTVPELLTIEGGSNGGLLVGATVNQRPELFKVAIPRVGVMDMMRYHLFTIGWNWAADYGTSADSPEMAQYLLRYSPLHNIKNDGTSYPAILVTTADHDDRVVPAHSFKYAARLQASDTGNNPKLIRIDSKAGHGGGKPISKTIDEWADIYSFIFNNLGVNPHVSK
ncbi:MAG: S9 family peptidase [Muribaculaceae bacterium]|nr:S9 family peptidase [Muribaculaceae bacterium]